MTAEPVELQRRLTSLLLDAIGGDGFALAGSGAIREHGITDRPTQDVDLFAASAMSPDQFDHALAQAERTLREHGYEVTRARSAPLFARLLVADPDGAALEVDLAVDWRAEPPVRLEVGPVLSLRDAVGSKVAAVYSRGEVRDFLDLDAIRQSGRFTDTELLRLAHDHDGGFEIPTFARQLARASRLVPDRTLPYGVDELALNQVRQRLTAWATQLHRPVDPPDITPLAPTIEPPQGPEPRHL